MITKIFKKNLPGPAKIINGSTIASKILEEYKYKINKLIQDSGTRPGLGIIQIGDRHDSNIYIQKKLQASCKIGVDAFLFKYDKNISKNQVLDKIIELNNDPKINGIITQLPLEISNRFDYTDLTNLVVPEKDVDCLSSSCYNNLCNHKFLENFVPCAANACLKILESINCSIAGKRVVILGSSKLVGLPLKHLMEFKKADTFLCDKTTKDLKFLCQTADILIVAIGCSQFINADYIKPGAVVIDVGINYDETNRKVTGDVHFEQALQKASYITPVPGGVGPVTVSMLMMNTYKAALKHHRNKISHG
ncbi:C-1-tetrahydrofolate cytoplasmic [Brachionus plicatilis]|uniref:C-1-tetrahydrofolate synthase, cytoplasmic n=1 Tax=Brachionus plicatilis TaxID=10195 RepID=A0A3M7SA73_BRAPC|nr:C-1-tetrahydrofolate cytoplasmic [Brachionus plicatilis]